MVIFTTLAPPPANDNCGTPTAITPGATFAQNPITGTTIGATLHLTLLLQQLVKQQGLLILGIL